MAVVGYNSNPDERGPEIGVETCLLLDHAPQACITISHGYASTVLALRSDELRAFILQCQSVLAQFGEEPVRIVCLCSSTRYLEAFQWANLHETLAQHIVLGLGCYTKSDDQLFVAFSEAEKAKQKAKLDELHKRKIDLAHEILVLDVDTYIGSSTQSEIEYAQQGGKPIRYLSQEVSQEMQPGQKSEQGA